MLICLPLLSDNSAPELWSILLVRTASMMSLTAHHADALLWSAIHSATKRIYVHESIYDEMSATLTAIAKGTKVGDGSDPATG